ncbi:MAG: hypothetical protein RJQ09_21085 [Cyclobacteriaceae bacterium]
MRNLTVSACILLVFASCQEQKPQKREAEYRIAYNVYLPDSSGENYDIFIMNLDGSDKRNITNHQDIAWVYSSTPDKLLFLSDRDSSYRSFSFYSMDHEGGQVTKISDFLLRDSWLGSRKNGTEFIVNPSPKIDSVFHIIDDKGELLSRVDTQLPFASDPTFSPDGKQIAFRGALKKSKREPSFNEAIYVMKDDASDLNRITKYPESDTTANWFDYRAGAPRWHPSGDFISFQSFQKGKYSLWAVSMDGSEQWKLTENPQNEGWHHWSPDGKWLVIELFDNDQTQFHIGLMEWKTKELQILTDSSFKYQQAPVFVGVK